jgi:hypothetical protein
MPRDHLDEVTNIEVSRMQREAMEGPGFLEYSIRTSFRDLCRLIGFENARAEVAEIILSEADRKRITIDG